MDLRLAGRAYILTGASRGLGFATAECLVADGARVLVSGRDQSRVDAAVARLTGGPGGPGWGREGGDGGGGGGGGEESAAGLAADLGDPGAPERLVDTALERFGRLDGALLSVGGPPRGTALQVTDDQWLEAFTTVFLGAVRAARVIGERLGDGGAIGLVLSSSVRSPITGLGISNGLRPGLAMVAKDMADELGPRGVRVVSLLPGRFETDRNRELFDASPDPAGARAEAASTIPLRRIGEPDEFGRVAAFLLSPAASYVSGAAFAIDGGMLRAL